MASGPFVTESSNFVFTPGPYVYKLFCTATYILNFETIFHFPISDVCQIRTGPMDLFFTHAHNT